MENKKLKYSVSIFYDNEVVGTEEREVDATKLLPLKRERAFYVEEAMSKLTRKVVVESLKVIDAKLEAEKNPLA